MVIRVDTEMNRTLLLITLISLPVLAEFQSSSPPFRESGLLSSELQEPGFLPVDEAFRLSVDDNGGKLTVYWQIAPGYYLYRHRLRITGADVAEFPDGEPKHDEIFGDVQVFFDSLTLTGTFPEDGGKILVEYQGCAEKGLCYPPQEREFIF